MNTVENALSLQIQAYLTTACDELYAPGKPLHTKEHYEGIHKCMKMWQKLHHYYFSKKAGAEWCDEDEEIAQNILEFLEDPFTAQLCPKLREESQDWIKSLQKRLDLHSC